MSYLFRNTASQFGRNISITPRNSDFQLISAGRIILAKDVLTASGENKGSETSLICLHGSGIVKVDGKEFHVSRFDGVYVPRGARFGVSTDKNIDIVEASAPTEKTFEPVHVKFSDIVNDPALTLRVGAEPYYRDIHKIICENVKGSRLLTGVTMSKPGNWTSWPPHEHAATREELYLYFDMPAPGFGTQYIYTDLQKPEFVENVFQDDAAVIVKGYHPNVAAPGYPINFCWALCSLEEETWRTLANVNVQPGFESMPTGLR
ncbi:MAG TPA: 5-deoxy-glucuronate isomerase [Candidatus Kapabacteria bacterium]|nr:5-deoxy-glucuronate isomerase [Candidatus Kapabacteria bacterium]